MNNTSFNVFTFIFCGAVTQPVILIVSEHEVNMWYKHLPDIMYTCVCMGK